MKAFDWNVLGHRLLVGILGAVLAMLQQHASDPRDWAIAILTAAVAAASYDQIAYQLGQGGVAAK